MIIDAHSHVGHDWMLPKTNITDYKELLKKNNIDAGIIMPEPGHISEVSGKRFLLWNFDKKQGIRYYSPHYNNDTIDGLKGISKTINDEIYQEIIAEDDMSTRLFFAAMVHPVVDNVDYYNELKFLPKCVALKFHGIAGGFSPEMIDKAHIKAIRDTGLPLIIHTDYDVNQNSDLGRIRNMNSPRKWFEFLKRNDLKGYLCHGCRLDLNLLDEIAYTENILVGIGPDFAIQNDPSRLINPANPSYIAALSSHLPKEKLAFDIDYNYLEGDLHFMDRLKSLLPRTYYENVMGQNAFNFFNLKQYCGN